jgi:hypothetical protein
MRRRWAAHNGCRRVASPGVPRSCSGGGGSLRGSQARAGAGGGGGVGAVARVLVGWWLGWRRPGRPLPCTGDHGHGQCSRSVRSCYLVPAVHQHWGDAAGGPRCTHCGRARFRWLRFRCVSMQTFGCASTCLSSSRTRINYIFGTRLRTMHNYRWRGGGLPLPKQHHDTRGATMAAAWQGLVQ